MVKPRYAPAGSARGARRHKSDPNRAGNLQPLRLNVIQPMPINSGGYRISHSGRVPPGFGVGLSVGSGHHTMDISSGLNARNLPELLDLMRAQSVWGRSASCRVFLHETGVIVQGTESNVQPISCPVQPYTGELELEKLGRSQPPLRYTGNGHGRVLTAEIDGAYYFKYGGNFETNPAMRGFDCTTFIGSAFGLQSGMDGYGTKLATELGATQCGLENKGEAEIKSFFERNIRGKYIMWSSTHVVMIVDGLVHEFSESAHGYRKTDVQGWNFYGRSYWVRKV